MLQQRQSLNARDYRDSKMKGAFNDQVWERLFIGGLADAEELADDNPSRITTVISLSEIPVESKRQGINYLHLAHRGRRAGVRSAV